MPKKSPEEPKEIGRFAFGIILYKFSDGRVEYRFQSKNRGIPLEIILMQVKAFLRNQENQYFDKYDKNATFQNDSDNDNDEK